MRFVCDAPGGRTWFSIETQAEADAESELMRHAVARFFAKTTEMARRNYVPRPGLAPFERDIGLKDFILRTAPTFLTLRDGEGNGLATAMLPPRSPSGQSVRVIIVGPDNTDPYVQHAEAIEALGAHFGLFLPREICFPYS